LLQEHGKAYGVYHSYQGQYATAEDFEETYRGVYESEEDFVREQWEEQGITKQLEELGILDAYINWEAIARDWFIDSYYSVEIDNETYVFTRC